MADEAVDLEIAGRARELYWGSDRGVNAIANELGLSKGRFYQLIAPLPSGRTCPRCGGETVYENRSAKEKDEPTCPACAAAALGRVAPPTSSAPRPAPPPAAEPTSEAEPRAARGAGERPARSRPTGSPSGSGGTRLLAGLLIGGLAGLLLYRLVRRSR